MLNMCRIYDPDRYRVVQTNVGHQDAVRNIMYVPERDQVCGNFVLFYHASWLADIVRSKPDVNWKNNVLS